MQEDVLFEIALNNEGRGHILRLFARVKFILIATIIWTVINLFSTISSFSLTMRVIRQNNSVGIDLRLMVIYLYTFLSIILLPAQSWYFYGFSKRISESIEEQDAIKFNSSFRLLNINIIICLVTILFNITFTLFNILYTYLR